MSWFSKVEYRASSRDPAGHRELARMLDNPYYQHQRLWTLFDQPPGSTRPFLFHHQLDAARPGQAAFWMISTLQPQAPEPGWTIRSKPYHPAFRAGQRLAFQLRVNPSVKRLGTNGKSQRYDPIALALQALPALQRAAERQRWIHRELAPWLAARGATYGFDLEIDRTVVLRYEPLRFPGGRSGREIRLSVADFRGVLRVRDPLRFGEAAIAGVGHARGFGCGALLLKPVREAATRHAGEEEE